MSKSSNSRYLLIAVMCLSLVSEVDCRLRLYYTKLINLQKLSFNCSSPKLEKMLTQHLQPQCNKHKCYSLSLTRHCNRPVKCIAKQTCIVEEKMKSKMISLKCPKNASTIRIHKLRYMTLNNMQHTVKSSPVMLKTTHAIQSRSCCKSPKIFIKKRRCYNEMKKYHEYVKYLNRQDLGKNFQVLSLDHGNHCYDRNGKLQGISDCGRRRDLWGGNCSADFVKVIYKCLELAQSFKHELSNAHERGSSLKSVITTTKEIKYSQVC